MPRRRDEVALGTDTAADRGLELGDSVQIGVYDFVQEATVSALVVFPSLGPILSDRVGAGTGMFVPQALFDAPELDWLRADALSLTSFVGVDLVDDDPAHVADVEQRLKRLETDSGGGLYLSTAIRPPEIIDAGSTRDVPFGVAAVLAAVGAVGLGLAAWASVRARRRDVAVLRTLGFSDSQVRRSVQLQMIATMLAGLVVGVPVGVISGRLLWRAFAEQLGVIREPASPAGPVVMALTGGIAIALIAAQLPAALATRARPAQGLRTE
jgi:putative ABC transport system permease protein